MSTGTGASPVISGSPVTTSPSVPSPLPDALAGCAPAQQFQSLRTMARVSGADDVAAAPDGSVWISDAKSLIEHVGVRGDVEQRIDDPRVPEGIVVLGDGTLVVAEQGPDRVVRIDPSTQTTTTLLQLTPRSGVEGVDGIAYDATRNAVIVPDSPNGTLLEYSLTTGAAQQLASGLGRPVGAATTSEGLIAVAAEDAFGLFIVMPNRPGSGTQLGAVTQADDVIASGGVLYVTSLDTNRVLAVDANTGVAVPLIEGVAQPQGLALLPGGLIAVSDSISGRVATATPC